MKINFPSGYYDIVIAFLSVSLSHSLSLHVSDWNQDQDQDQVHNQCYYQTAYYRELLWSGIMVQHGMTVTKCAMNQSYGKLSTEPPARKVGL